MKDLLLKETLMEDDAALPADPGAPAPADAAPAPAPSAGGKELVMKVTGLPDDLELDKLNIDLISDESEEDMNAPAPELAAGPTPESTPMESYNMDENNEMLETDEVELSELDEEDVVEISESMLKRELSRLKSARLNEHDYDVLQDFGGGEDEGEPFLDGEVSTADKDNMVKQSGKPGTTDKVKTPPKGRVAEAKRAIAARRAKIVSESTKNVDYKQLAESRAAKIESLRKQLTETNLLSAKLLKANKLLQQEGLSSTQKAQIIDRLDEAESLREVKLVYETLVKAFVSKKNSTISENTAPRSVIAGSSSRMMSRSSVAPVLNEGTTEGFETTRWAELAGIYSKKK
jgi:hypothetical protein